VVHTSRTLQQRYEFFAHDIIIIYCLVYVVVVVFVVVVVVDCGDNDDGVRAQPDYDDDPGLWPVCCYIIHALHTRERVCIHHANNNYYYSFVYYDIKEKKCFISYRRTNGRNRIAADHECATCVCGTRHITVNAPPTPRRASVKKCAFFVYARATYS